MASKGIRIAAAAVVAGLAICATFVLTREAPQQHDKATVAKTSENAALDGKLAEADIRAPGAQHGQAKDSAPRAQNPFPEVPRSRTGLSLEDDPFNAESVEEQSWLDRHGYPNISQWTTYSQASDGMLQLAAESGDATAQTMLDARQLPQQPAVDRLLLSAADGNDFALQLLASHYAGSGPDHYVDAYTVARVSEMRGNLSAAISREMLFRRPLSSEQRMRGEAGALRLNATLNRLYKEKNGIEFSADNRPITIKK